MERYLKVLKLSTFLFSLIALYACKKGPDQFYTKDDGIPSILIINDINAQMQLTINGKLDTLDPGKSIKLTGTPGDSIIASATPLVYKKYSNSVNNLSGFLQEVGETFVIKLNTTFPKQGTTYKNIQMPLDYYLLMIYSDSYIGIDRVTINYNMPTSKSFSFLRTANINGHVINVADPIITDTKPNPIGFFKSGTYTSFAFHSIFGREWIYQMVAPQQGEELKYFIK